MKILFASTPAPGHLNPLLTIARFARARGHETLVTTAHVLAPIVEASGARFLPLAEGADLDFRDMEALFPERSQLPPGPAQLRFDFEKIFIEPMLPQAATLRAIIAAEAPDLIVADSLFCGTTPLFLDNTSERPPIVACGVTFLTLDRPDGAPTGIGLPPARSEEEKNGYAAMAAGFEAAFATPIRQRAEADLKKLGLPGLPASFLQSRVLLADAFLQPTVRGFEYDFGKLPETLHFIGALPPPPYLAPEPAWRADLDGSRKVVLVTQGTVANQDFGQLVEPTLAALAGREDLLVLVTTGGRPLDAIKGEIPKNARLAPFLAFESILPKVDLLVTNGGYGTVSLALQAGVPIISSGLTEDKAEVGTRVAWSGVGMNLAATVPSVEAVRGAVDEVLSNPAYRARAQQMAEDFKTLDAEREIFTIFERLLDTRARVAEPAARRA